MNNVNSEMSLEAMRAERRTDRYRTSDTPSIPIMIKDITNLLYMYSNQFEAVTSVYQLVSVKLHLRFGRHCSEGGWTDINRVGSYAGALFLRCVYYHFPRTQSRNYGGGYARQTSGIIKRYAHNRFTGSYGSISHWMGCRMQRQSCGGRLSIRSSPRSSNQNERLAILVRKLFTEGLKHKTVQILIDNSSAYISITCVVQVQI